MEKELVLIGLTISYLLIASVSDIKRKQVDDWISLGIAAIGLIGFRPENLWGIFPAAIMLIVAYLTGGRPGGADIKLFAALTLSCGLWKSMLILFIAQLTNLIAFVICHLILRTKKHCGTCRFAYPDKAENSERQELPKAARLSMPFVPFITLGYLLCIFCTI